MFFMNRSYRSLCSCCMGPIVGAGVVVEVVVVVVVVAGVDDVIVMF